VLVQQLLRAQFALVIVVVAVIVTARSDRAAVVRADGTARP